MTGRIKSLSAGSESGYIKAEHGLSVYFNSSSVLAYDVACLAVGQMVTFDLEGGDRLRAVNVCVQRQHETPRPAPEKRREPTDLRYMGFEQVGSERAYKFDCLWPGKEATLFVVTADLALFRKHHVDIQDGPALCLHVLVSELEAAGSTQRLPSKRSLTDENMLAHIASRPAPRAKTRPKRGPAAHSAPRVESEQQSRKQTAAS